MSIIYYNDFAAVAFPEKGLSVLANDQNNQSEEDLTKYYVSDVKGSSLSSLLITTQGLTPCVVQRVGAFLRGSPEFLIVFLEIPGSEEIDGGFLAST
jgi:hypothetical protein